MKNLISILFALLLFVATGFAAENDSTVPGEGEITCNGTITINVDDGYEITNHPVTGDLNVCKHIRNLDAGNDNAEGSYSVSKVGANVQGVEDSSSDDITITFTPTSTSFSIIVYITTGDPTTYGDPGPCN
jgi:hypothetical protein